MTYWDKRYQEGTGLRWWPESALVQYIGSQYDVIPYQHKASGKALDLGCGTGRHIWLLEESGFDAYGVDSSEEGVIRACAYLAQRGCEARALVHASCTKLIFEANTFDLVVDCQTIQHLSENDHGKAYAEVARVLKPFGRFWTMHYAEGDAKEIYAGQYPELRRWRLSELGGLIEEAGLQEVSVELLQRGNVRKSQSIVWWVMSFVKTGGQR